MSMVLNKFSINKALLIKWTITIVIPLLLFLIPTNEVFTEQIRLFLFLTLFVIFILAFETLDYIIPGILLPSAYALFGLVPTGVAFGAWASYLPWMLIGAYVLANVFMDTKFMNRILYYCILKLGGGFKTTCLGMMITGCVVNLISGGMAMLLIVVLCYGIAKSFEIEMKSKESIVLMMSGTIGAITSNCFVPVPTTIGMLNAGGRLVDPNFAMSWGAFVWHNCPYILFMAMFMLLLFKIYKPAVAADGKAYFEAEYTKLGSMSSAEKKCALVAIILLVFLFTSGIHKMDVSWGFVILPWLLFLPGMNVGQKKHIQVVDFGIVVFALMCVGIGIVSQALGFGTLFSNWMVPILANANSSSLMLLVTLAGIILNLLLTPMAVIGAFAGPFAIIANDLGINILPIFYALSSSMDQVFMPYEYMPYLLFFSYGFIKMADFIKIFTLKAILHTIFILIVMVPWWKFIGLL